MERNLKAKITAVIKVMLAIKEESSEIQGLPLSSAN